MKPRQEPEGFKEFWDVWRPNARHTDGRGLAREAFAKHIKAGANPQDIIDGAKCFFRTMKERDREFVPLSATWLNRGAYEDLAVQERAYQARATEQRRKAEEARTAPPPVEQPVSAPSVSPERRAEMMRQLSEMRQTAAQLRTMQ